MYRTKEHVIWDETNRANFAGGRKKGQEEGREEGREEGALAEKSEIAKRLKIRGIDLEIIAEATAFSIEEIDAL